MSIGTYSRIRLQPQRQCPCVVPYCAKRTSRGKDNGSVWFCSRHWGAIPQRWRAAYRKISPSNNYDLFDRLLARLVGFAVTASLSDSKVRFEERSL